MAARRREIDAPDAAIARYRELLSRYAEFAELHYRLARMLERKEEWKDAYDHYIAARDRDGYPMRARRTSNKRTATSHCGITASSSIHKRISIRLAATGCWTMNCFKTRCTRHYGARSLWPRRRASDSEPGELSTGRKKHRYPSSILRSVPSDLASTRACGESCVYGGSSSTASPPR